MSDLEIRMHFVVKIYKLFIQIKIIDRKKKDYQKMKYFFYYLILQ